MNIYFFLSSSFFFSLLDHTSSNATRHPFIPYSFSVQPHIFVPGGKMILPFLSVFPYRLTIRIVCVFVSFSGKQIAHETLQ